MSASARAYASARRTPVSPAGGRGGRGWRQVPEEHCERFVEAGGSGLGFGRTLDEDHRFAAPHVRIAFRAKRQFSEAAAIKGLESLGQLARNAGATRFAAGDSKIFETVAVRGGAS